MKTVLAFVVVVLLVAGVLAQQVFFSKDTVSKLQIVQAVNAREYMDYPFRLDTVDLGCEMERVNPRGDSEANGSVKRINRTYIQLDSATTVTIAQKRELDRGLYLSRRHVHDGLDYEYTETDFELVRQLQPTNVHELELIDAYGRYFDAQVLRAKQGLITDNTGESRRYKHLDMAHNFDRQIKQAHKMAEEMCLEKVKTNKNFYGTTIVPLLLQIENP